MLTRELEQARRCIDLLHRTHPWYYSVEVDDILRDGESSPERSVLGDFSVKDHSGGVAGAQTQPAVPFVEASSMNTASVFTTTRDNLQLWDGYESPSGFHLSGDLHLCNTLATESDINLPGCFDQPSISAGRNLKRI